MLYRINIFNLIKGGYELIPVLGYNASVLIDDEFHVCIPNSGCSFDSGETGTIYVLISGRTDMKLTSGNTVTLNCIALMVRIT
jgi:hypothetical protein